MQDTKTLLGSKSFAEQSVQYSVTEPGFPKCPFSYPIYFFPHNKRKQLQDERWSVLFTLSSRMDDNQVVEALSQQTFVYAFQLHQSQKGLKSNSLYLCVIILTAKPLYTGGPFSPDSFFLKHKQAKKPQPQTNPHSIYQRENSCKYLLSKELEICTLRQLKDIPVF